MVSRGALLAASLLLSTLASAFASPDTGVVTALRPRLNARKLMQVEPLGCSYFRSPMWDCASREWACCYGNVFEYYGADPVTMMYFDFNEGAACMLCCAGNHVRCKDNTCRETCEDPAPQDSTAATEDAATEDAATEDAAAAQNATAALDASAAEDTDVPAAQEDQTTS